MTRFFVDASNNYIGGFDGADAETRIPDGAVEVPVAPSDARQKWNGSSFDAAPPPPDIPSPDEILEALLKNEEGDSSELDAIKVRRAGGRP